MRILNKNKGFTLLEILVATVILGMALTAIIQLFSMGLKSRKLVDEYDKAAWHAVVAIETSFLTSAQNFEGDWDDGYKWTVIYQSMADRTEVQENQDKASDNMWESSVLDHISCKVEWESGSKNRFIKVDTLGNIALP